MKKKKPRIVKQQVKIKGLKATLNGEPLEVITFICGGVLHIVNALASVSTPITGFDEPNKTEDADFEIIQPKQLTDAKEKI